MIISFVSTITAAKEAQQITYSNINLIQLVMDNKHHIMVVHTATSIVGMRNHR